MEQFPVYRFGEFALDSAQRRLLRSGQDVYLPPKTYELLLYLLRNRGRVIPKDELLEGVWPDVNVVENTLAQRIREIRDALGDGAHGARFIRTVPRVGYQFIAARDDEPRGAPDAPPVSASLEAPDVQAVSDREAIESHFSVYGRTRLALPLIACAILAAVIATASFVRTTRTKLPAGSPAPITSVAVLPCKPLLAEGRDHSLELGMADSLIFKLGSVGRITVRPLSAVRRYTDLAQDAVEAGRALRVESVLECNIQRVQDRIRVRATLFHVRSGQLLWAEQFDENRTDVFALQDHISQRVAGALALTLTGDEQRRLAKRYTDNVEAYRAYERGRYHWSKGTGDGYRKSIEEFQASIALDRNYALALAGLADSYNLLGSYGELPMREARQKARVFAEAAIRLDDHLAEAHTSLGAIIASVDWAWPEAERHFVRAIDLDPQFATAHEWYSEYLSWMGRHEEAILAAQRAVDLNQVSLSANSHVGMALYRARRYGPAVERLRETLELDQDFADAHVTLGVTLVQTKMYDEAIESFKKAMTLTDNSPEIVGLLGYGYGMAGLKVEAQETLRELDRLSQQGRYVSSFSRATVYIGLDEKNLAFDWLEKSYRERVWYLALLAVDPLFDRLHSDPRYAGLLKRMNLQAGG